MRFEEILGRASLVKSHAAILGLLHSALRCFAAGISMRSFGAGMPVEPTRLSGLPALRNPEGRLARPHSVNEPSRAPSVPGIRRTPSYAATGDEGTSPPDGPSSFNNASITIFNSFLFNDLICLRRQKMVFSFCVLMLMTEGICQASL